MAFALIARRNARKEIQEKGLTMANWKEWQFVREYNEVMSDALREESLGHHTAANRLFDYAEEVRENAWFYAGVML